MISSHVRCESLKDILWYRLSVPCIKRKFDDCIFLLSISLMKIQLGTLYFDRFCDNRVNLSRQVNSISDMKPPANYPDNCALPVPSHKIFLYYLLWRLIPSESICHINWENKFCEIFYKATYIGIGTKFK